MAKKRVCMTCGKEYTYCPQCDSKVSRETWHINWCSEECRDVYDILTSYGMNQCSEADVKAVLNKYGVTDYNKYKPSINEALKKIIYTPAKVEAPKAEAPKAEAEKVNPEAKKGVFNKKQAD